MNKDKAAIIILGAILGTLFSLIIISIKPLIGWSQTDFEKYCDKRKGSIIYTHKEDMLCLRPEHLEGLK